MTTQTITFQCACAITGALLDTWTEQLDASGYAERCEDLWIDVVGVWGVEQYNVVTNERYTYRVLK